MFHTYLAPSLSLISTFCRSLTTEEPAEITGSCGSSAGEYVSWRVGTFWCRESKSREV